MENFGGCRTDNYGRNLGGLEVWDLLKLGKIWGAGKLLTMGKIFRGGVKKKKKPFLGSPPAKNEPIKLEILGLTAGKTETLGHLLIAFIPCLYL